MTSKTTAPRKWSLFHASLDIKFNHHPVGVACGTGVLGMMGYFAAPLYGLSHASMVVGGIGPLLIATMLGAAILTVPYLLLDNLVSYGIRYAEIRESPWLRWSLKALDVALMILFTVSSAMLGASLLGLTVNAFGACAFAGIVTSIVLSIALFGGAQLLSLGSSIDLSTMFTSMSPSFAHHATQVPSDSLCHFSL